MADAKKTKPSSPWNDLWWFLGLMVAFFFLWVMGGGPERANKSNEGPILGKPISSQNSTPSNKTTSQKTPSSGEMKVTPVN